MRILFFGDIIGRVARNKLADAAHGIAARLDADMLIANAENSAHGFGVTERVAEKLLSQFDVITSGDHICDQSEIASFIKKEPRLLRPENWGKLGAGSGHLLYKKGGRRVLVINLLGQVLMKRDGVDNPFFAADKILEEFKLGKNADAIFVDFHAEASSEKIALAHYLDGRVSAVVGTHTHVPTADERILPHGTAFQTDAGSCSDFDSVIGMQKPDAIGRLTGAEDAKLKPAEGPPTLCGTLIEVGPDGLARKIERVMEGKPLNG